MKIQLKIFLILSLVIAGTFFISGSLAAGSESDNFNDIGMTSFKSESEMKSFFEKALTFGSPAYLNYNGTNGYDMPTDTPAFSTYYGDNYDYPTQGIQIASANEADLVKTNGEIIFYSPGQFYIKNITYHTDGDYPYYDYDTYQMTFAVNALPAKTASIISNITETGGRLHLEDNVLLTIGYRNNSSFVEAYDIADPASPQKLWIQNYDGSYSNSRLIDGKLYLISQKNFAPVPISYMGKEIVYDDCYYPYGPSLLMPTMESTYFVSEVNVQTGDFTNTIALFGSNNSTLFVTDDNVYMTNYYYPDSQRMYLDFIESNGSDYLPSDFMQYFKKVNGYDLSDHAKYVAIDAAVGNYIRSLTEEEAGKVLTAFYEDYNKYFLDLVEKGEKTTLTKINLETFEVTSGFVSGKIYDSSMESYGFVPGRVGNQSPLNETDGYLRVVSTVSSIWMLEESESETIVSVLDENMNVVGRLEGLAVGGNVRNIFYTENKLYMANYDYSSYEINPFFVVDLSIPETPVLLGNLKVTEYYGYYYDYYDSFLYPLNDTLLVSFGPSGGWTRRNTLSLYDVSDPFNPIELDAFSFKSNEYINIYNNAFTWDDEKGLMTVSGSDYTYLFEINDEGLNMLVKDRHYWSQSRSVVCIDDCLYILSDQDIRVYDQNTGKRIRVIPIPQPVYPDYNFIY
jgi:Secreted protein containing C-terminal beta-propeller domain distantly related to WD-40 repeats